MNWLKSLENQIVNRQSCEEQDEVAIPETGRNVVPDALVLLRLVFIFVLDADDVFLEIKTAECKTCEAD